MKLPIYKCQLVRQASVDYALRTAGKLVSSQAAVRNVPTLVTPFMENAPNEVFAVVSVDTSYKPIGVHIVTEGTLDASLVHPREVFRGPILCNASAIFLVHNHPSGSLDPSPQDKEVTSRLTECGKLLGVNVLDHIIVAHDGEKLVGVSIRECE